MAFDHDPDGKQKGILDSSAQTIQIEANKGAFLFGSFDAAWEQAVVVFVDGNRLGDQIGNFNRKTFIVVGKKDTPQQITLVGWHKRGQADAQLPWFASRGQTQGEVVSWDDSGGDGDFNDAKVKFVID